MDNGKELHVIDHFNRIALTVERWDHNNHFHSEIIGALPDNCGYALDIGCGTGIFSELLASHCKKVTGVDISEEMIKQARKLHSKGNVEYVVDEVTHFLSDKEDHFDIIVSVASFHHMDQEKVLRMCKKALKNNGILYVVDLYKESGIIDYIFFLASMVLNPFYKYIRNGYLIEPKEERDLWKIHSKDDHYSTLMELRGIANKVLENYKMNRKVFWRYMLEYRKKT